MFHIGRGLAVATGAETMCRQLRMISDRRFRPRDRRAIAQKENNMNTIGRALALGCALVVTAGCQNDDGISTAELQAAAEERVARELGLSKDAALFTSVFVSEPDSGELEGELVFCGRVEGTRADGTPIAPRRFIAASDPARWVRFDIPSEMSQVPINLAVDWPTVCAGENEVK